MKYQGIADCLNDFKEKRNLDIFHQKEWGITVTWDVIILAMADKTGLNNVRVSTPLMVGITLYLYIKQHWCSACASQDMWHIPQGSAVRDRKTGKCSNMGDKPSFCQKKSLRTSALESKTKKPHSEKIQVEFRDCLSSCLSSWLSYSVNTVLRGHAWYDFPRLLPLLPGNPHHHHNPSLQWQLCLAYICVIHWTSSIPALTGPVSSPTSVLHMLASFLVSRAPGLCLKKPDSQRKNKGTSEKHSFEADVLGSNSGSLVFHLLIFKRYFTALASYLASPCMYIMNSDCSPQYRLLFPPTPFHPFLRFLMFCFVLWPI